MSVKRWVLWGSLALFPLSSLTASATEAGAVFLTIFPGARAAGMAAAFSAVADDATASYYNPGGLAFFEETQVALVHAPWLPALAKDMFYEFVGFVHPLKQGVLGGHIIYLNLGNVDAYDAEGNYIGSWKPADYAFTLAYGFPLNPHLGLGFSGKIIRSFLAPPEVIKVILDEPGGGNAMSFALGAGVYYKTRLRGLTLAAVVDNLGPGLKFTGSGRREDLPYLLRLGAAYRPVWNDVHRLLLAVDVNKVLVKLSDDLQKHGINWVLREAFKHFGVEYTLLNLLSIRMGYFLDEMGARKGFTFGFGFRAGPLQLDYGNDSRIYAFYEPGDPLNQRFSLTYIMQR